MTDHSSVDRLGRCRIEDQPECHRSGYSVPESRPEATTSPLLADPAQVTLIRDLYAHARHVRAEHAIYSFGNGLGQPMGPVEHTWTAGHHRVSVQGDCLIYESNGTVLMSAAGVDSVRKAAELLAAIGVLPQRFIGGAR